MEREKEGRAKGEGLGTAAGATPLEVVEWKRERWRLKGSDGLELLPVLAGSCQDEASGGVGTIKEGGAGGGLVAELRPWRWLLT